MNPNAPLTRRAALGTMAAGLAAPFVFRHHATAAPSETVLHASFGASGMAGADIGSLSGSKHFKLVAVAEVDLSRIADVKKKWPDVKVYQDWRELLDKEKGLNSVNVSTPDHMHAPITMRAMQQGLHVYTQKPLTQTIYEARQLARVAGEKKIISQMGIQIHSASEHKTIVDRVQSGLIGKISEVHSWSGKSWGDRNPRPKREDPIPKNLNWDLWLGVASERPFIEGYYHPGNWRKRLDFGTGTFGDMGCHILDPVFAALALTAPTSVHSDGEVPNDDSWALNTQVKYVFPQTKNSTKELSLTWYNGELRPPAEFVKKCGIEKLADQGSIFVGEEAIMYCPYIGFPILLPGEKFAAVRLGRTPGDNHYLQFVEAVRGNGTTSAPFSYSGPLTESVLLGCLATRFPKATLNWDATKLKVTNEEKANQYVRREYRKGFEVEGLSPGRG